MVMTMQEKYVSALLKRGEHEIKRTPKYIVFSRTTHLSDASGKNKNYYIGKNGALRVGCTIADSIK